MGKKVLGRGLSELLGGATPDDLVSHSLVRNVPINKISPNPFQPRTDFSEEEIRELADSISRSGLLQPLVLRPRRDADGFELVAGERRLRALKLLGWEECPAIIRDIGDREVALLALVENVQREALSPIEEARAYKSLMEKFSLTQEDISHLIGKSRSYVANVLRLLSLPPEVQERVGRGEISFSQARELLSGKASPEEIRQQAEIVMREKVTVREIRRKRMVDPFIRRFEETLQALLGTKVVLEHNSRKNRGKLVIEYYSLEDLDRIMDILREGRRISNEGSSFGVN